MIQDKIFNKTLLIIATLFLLLILGIFITLIIFSLPSWQEFGLSFLWQTEWNPVRNEFGALPFIVGTLLTSFIALFLCAPFSLSLSFFLGEYCKKGVFFQTLKGGIELLAGIPSIIYGFWGFFVLVPQIRRFQLYLIDLRMRTETGSIQEKLLEALEIVPYGVGILAAALILSIMIIPFAASLGQEVISMVPQDLKEAAYSLGATRFEVIKKVIFPHARSGILAGIFLALGRALGETMAVTMVIGNRNILTWNILNPANTMASLIANEFPEASDPIHLASIIQVGLWLFIVTFIINLCGKLIIHKMNYKE